MGSFKWHISCHSRCIVFFFYRKFQPPLQMMITVEKLIMCVAEHSTACPLTAVTKPNIIGGEQERRLDSLMVKTLHCQKCALMYRFMCRYVTLPRVAFEPIFLPSWGKCPSGLAMFPNGSHLACSKSFVCCFTQQQQYFSYIMAVI